MTLALTPPDWTEEALCGDSDPEAWFPNAGDPCLTVKDICSRCPVKQACLDYALTFDAYGIWGGTTQAERRLMRRKTA